MTVRLNTKAVDRALQAQADRFSSLEGGLALEGQSIVVSTDQPLLQLESSRDLPAMPPEVAGTAVTDPLPVSQRVQNSMEWPG